MVIVDIVMTIIGTVNTVDFVGTVIIEGTEVIWAQRQR